MDRTTIDGSRFYIHPTTAELMPSVTSIISSAGVSRGLMAWAAKMSAEFAVDNMAEWIHLDRDAAVKLVKGAAFRHSGRAMKVGTDAHAYAEQRLNGLAVPATKADALLAGAGDHACENVDKLIAGTGMTPVVTEAAVFSEDHVYAGTLDGIVDINGRLLLVDWKTSRGVYGEMALQMSGYRFATHIEMDGYVDVMPEVDGCAILHIPKEGPAALVELTCAREEFNTFLAYRQIFEWKASREKAAMINRMVFSAPALDPLEEKP